MPMISVIIPIYNAEKYLQSAVESVRRQTVSDLEILLIDDGSTDSSGSICERAAAEDSRIRIIRQEHQGISSGRNTGLREAAGSLIAFVDADDLVLPDYLGKMLEAMRACDVPLVCCNHSIVRENGTRLRFPADKVQILSEKQAFENILYHGIPDVSVWGKLARRELFTDVKYPEGKLFEDTYQIAELIHAAGKLAFIPDALYEYQIHRNSISHSTFSEAQLDLIDAVDHMTDYMDAVFPGEMTKGIQRRKMHALLSVRRCFVGMKTTPQKAELDRQIREMAGQVLSNPALPARDRVGIHAIQLGDWCFDALWKLTKRE